MDLEEEDQVVARIAMGILVLGLLSCGASQDPVMDCVDSKGIHPICGFQNPEDLALFDHGRSVVVSQFGGMEGEQPGSLAILDLATEELRVARRPGSEDRARGGAVAGGWGDPACPGPPSAEFAPHGIDLAPYAAGEEGGLRLLVVNHGGRESIEIFEVSGHGGEAAIEWRGCVIPPEGAFLNDIVSLPDGGFLVTHMMDRESQLSELVLASLGGNTGFVYEWHSEAGFRVVQGTEGPFPNGIELSADGEEIFLNYYLGNEVRRISRESGEVLARGEVRHPDNSSWAGDGRLLVASHLGAFWDQIACTPLEAGACPFEFAILAFDPETLESTEVFRNEGPPMGAATVAIDLGGELLMGSFAGDRVIRAATSARR